MSIGIQACDIVLPGYVLSERIGSGGYAEVWRAEAPGGIEKAVKIVYGYYNDEFASQELKALERIKGVRHPFLLSLERFEVIGGRLAILTELADMSLDQRLGQCQAEGLPGIPRDELLRYISDAAEALDFLAQRHKLLHLDIKPENLLISGDHIKVADFGLVKEIATRTQNSLISGMTPTYAAPEMFDDDPSAQSDQYSLAIVYQQMLTGTLPFPGRTAAQLAKQHTQAEPQLNSLPPNDRRVVARVLAKRPTDRFQSCTAFVNALLNRQDTADTESGKHLSRAVASPVPAQLPNLDDTKPSSNCQTLRRPAEGESPPSQLTCTQPVKRTAQVAAEPVENLGAVESDIDPETVDIAPPEFDLLLGSEQPTLYIGVGGVGIQLLCQLRALTFSQPESSEYNAAIESIALDTDRDELRQACSARWRAPLSSDDTLHLSLRLPKSYDDSPDIHGWVSRRWLYNIPRSLETRGYRPLGRVALVDHSQRLRGLIDRKLSRLGSLLGSANGAAEAPESTIRVVILAGTGGGTGAGIAIDLANAVKSLAVNHQLSIETHGIFICTCFANNASPLVAANTYSLLAELTHSTAFGNEGTSNTSTRTQMFESREAPFNRVYWLPIRARTADTDSLAQLNSAARYLALDTLPSTRIAIRSCRNASTLREQSRDQLLTIRHAAYSSLADEKGKLIHELASVLAIEVKQHLISVDTSANWARLIEEERQAATVPRMDKAKKCETTPGSVLPVSDSTPLALRARFKEYLSCQFASEIIFEIQSRLQNRDDRGRPLLAACDSKLIVDAARNTVAALAGNFENIPEESRFANSPSLQPLIFECSRRLVCNSLARFDSKHLEQFLPADSIDALIEIECHNLLKESLAQPEVATAIAALIDLDRSAVSMLEQVAADSPRCGSERRTFVFVPQANQLNAAVDRLRSARPLAAVVPASVSDVIIVSEESGISPRALADKIASAFPGITDAARRLHTRIDIDWKPL